MKNKNCPTYPILNRLVVKKLLTNDQIMYIRDLKASVNESELPIEDVRSIAKTFGVKLIENSRLNFAKRNRELDSYFKSKREFETDNHIIVIKKYKRKGFKQASDFCHELAHLIQYQLKTVYQDSNVTLTTKDAMYNDNSPLSAIIFTEQQAEAISRELMKIFFPHTWAKSKIKLKKYNNATYFTVEDWKWLKAYRKNNPDDIGLK